MTGKCKNCENNFKYSPSQRRGIYCSNKCQQEFQYNQNITDWLSKKITGKLKDGRPTDFVRRYMLEEAGNKCSECGWGKANPVNQIIYLEVDHIDGSRENGYKENLKVLCPNCHSLTDTYKNLNKKVGYHRERRRLNEQV